MADKPWQPSPDDLVSAIEKGSRKRRSDCRAFVEEFVETYAGDRSSAELDRVWTELVNEYPWYAEDLLHCLYQMTDDPRRALPEIVADVAELDAESKGLVDTLTPTDRQDLARRWIDEIYTKFSGIFEQLSSPSSIAKDGEPHAGEVGEDGPAK